MGAINFFESLQHMEPKCPKCETKIDYGVTTKFDSKLNCHICLKCGEALK